MAKMRLLAGVSALALMVAGCGDPELQNVSENQNELNEVVVEDETNVANEQ